MANQIILFRALDSNGYVISGAKAYVYLTGTFTIIPVYSDEAGTIPASNPVIADANGFFPQRFITQAARVAFKLADETTLYTMDPAPTAVGSGAGASQVSFAPTANIPQTTVQTAVEAVDTNARAREAAKQPLDADLTALAALAATGLIARTGAGAVAARTLVSADGTVVFTNPGGVAGNPDFSAKSGWEFVSQFYTGTSVATVDTPDFVAGYDYAVEMSWVRGVTNPATLQFAPFRVVAGTRPTAQSLKVSDSNYFSGWIEILAPMRTADQHHLSSQGTAYVDNNTVAYFGTITGNSALDWASTYGGTNDRVSSLRFSRGAGNISGGQMSLYRCPSRMT